LRSYLHEHFASPHAGERRLKPVLKIEDVFLPRHYDILERDFSALSRSGNIFRPAPYFIALEHIGAALLNNGPHLCGGQIIRRGKRLGSADTGIPRRGLASAFMRAICVSNSVIA
jgi:hypothetical protein